MVSNRFPRAASAAKPGEWASLFWDGLPTEAHQEVVDAVEDRIRAETLKQNPLWIDLGDTVPKHVLALLPALTAARSLSQPWHKSSDGTFAVRIVRSCAEPQAEQERCFSLDTPMNQRDPVERMARFAAWPLGYSIRISVESPTLRQALASRLRRLTERDEFGVALVFADDAAVVSDADLQVRLQSLAAKLPRSQMENDDGLLAVVGALAGRDQVRVSPTQLGFDENQIVIVPQLGRIARRDALVAKLKTELGDLLGQREVQLLP